MRSEPSRALFGGQAAVQSVPSAGFATGEGALARLARIRARIAAVLGASTILAITAATALPSSAPSNRAATPYAIVGKPRYRGPIKSRQFQRP